MPTNKAKKNLLFWLCLQLLLFLSASHSLSLFVYLTLGLVSFKFRLVGRVILCSLSVAAYCSVWVCGYPHSHPCISFGFMFGACDTLSKGPYSAHFLSNTHTHANMHLQTKICYDLLIYIFLVIILIDFSVGSYLGFVSVAEDVINTRAWY